MNFLVKIEALINHLLCKLGSFLWKLLVPSFLRNKVENLPDFKVLLLTFLKNLPSLVLAGIAKLKATLTGIDFKAKLKELYEKSLARYKTEGGASAGKLKLFFITPFLMAAEWVRDLTLLQSMTLFSFSGASVVAVVLMGFTVNDLLEKTNPAGRAPASVEETVTYDRPNYYKKDQRFLEISNLRLPVYVADVNELRSVDIDFVATMSTRESKNYLLKMEFQIRDHLVLNVEPSVAAFPLEEEGKDILRKKLIMELNDFLKASGIPGEVQEIKITYILSN